MDWQHRDDANKRYNFIAARDSENGIVGILGFILASRYDPAFARRCRYDVADHLEGAPGFRARARAVAAEASSTRMLLRNGAVRSA